GGRRSNAQLRPAAVGRNVLPVDLRQGLAAARRFVQRTQAPDEGPIVANAVRLVRQVEQTLRLTQVAEIEIRGVERKVFVVGCEDVELGLGQRRAVAVGVDDFPQRLALRRSENLVEAE